MASARKRFKPNRNEFDRMGEDMGLQGVLHKDMSLYPKLQVCPLPIPYSDERVTEKMARLNELAADLDEKFRESPGKQASNIFWKDLYSRKPERNSYMII